MAKQPRRRCKICREWFHPRSFNEWWCSPEHGAVFGIQERDKQRQRDIQKAETQRKEQTQAERRSLKIRKLAVKPLSYFHSKAQIAFNEFIRVRDSGHSCISCGRNTGAKMNAGHYRTVGASKETRYDETNCHLQCEHCNSHLSGNIGEYKPRLIAKIGQEAFDRLIGFHEPKKWTREELQDLAAHYRAKTRALKKQLEAA
ncbi:recombination protein NinG [Serratia sp. JSRIV006]|uniref:recombination protein NinG n=1 Tax=Serratia sp. JSRIV006 TaxID=2831896 RepID=UPI001CC0146F|nr:recombination protein NinG [Serratia sp. JSRIV006]UAN64282.1 recombination protein NinG [Serratia sp. JSRIV006]